MNPNELNLKELKSEFGRKRLALEFAEQAKKPKALIQELYKELKEIQVKLVLAESMERAKKDLDHA